MSRLGTSWERNHLEHQASPRLPSQRQGERLDHQGGSLRAVRRLEEGFWTSDRCRRAACAWGLRAGSPEKPPLAQPPRGSSTKRATGIKIAGPAPQRAETLVPGDYPAVNPVPPPITPGSSEILTSLRVTPEAKSREAPRAGPVSSSQAWQLITHRCFPAPGKPVLPTDVPKAVGRWLLARQLGLLVPVLQGTCGGPWAALLEATRQADAKL